MLICHGQGHSALIIRQFRTVHFLVNILFSGRESEKRKQAGGWGGVSLSRPSLSHYWCLCQLRSENRNNWWVAPPTSSPQPASSPGVSFAGTDWGGGGGWRVWEKKKKAADEAQSFNEGWDTTVIYLSVTQTPFHHRPAGRPSSTEGE